MKKACTLTLTKEEDEEFRRFFDATSQCSGATLHEIGQFVQRRKLWGKDKIRKFIGWFILEGLQEEWLIDEMSG